jgi:hypothetical protein
VVVLAPQGTSWATEQARTLPWLGLDVLDASASTALWASPVLAQGDPALAGLVVARELAGHFDLAYTPPGSPPTGIPGLAQWILPVATVDLEDARARATAVLSDPRTSMVADPDPAVRLALAHSSRDSAVLEALARDAEPLVRARAADKLESVLLLTELAEDPSSVVRVVATHNLARQAQAGDESPELRRALSGIASTAPDAYQRWKAAYGLGRVPGEVPALVRLLDDPDVDVRREAVSGLGRQGDPTAVEPLLGALQDPNSFLRTTAAQALGELGDARAAPALRRTLRDPTALVASAASEALRRLGEDAPSVRYTPPGPQASRTELESMLASEDATLRKDACKFTPGRDGALELLAPATSDVDPEVRKSAANALGWVPGSVPLLLPLLADPDPDVLVATLESLRAAGGFEPAALEPFLTHTDAELRLRAAEAVASLGPHPSLEVLADDPDERVRAAFATAYPARVGPQEPSVLVRRAAAQSLPERWNVDPSALVRFAAADPPDPHGAFWALGVIAREDQLVHLRFSFNDERRIPSSHQSLRPPVVREYGHPDRG